MPPNAGQLQAWPTPEMFIRRGKPVGNINENAQASVSLVSAILGVPLARSVSDSGVAGASLASVVNIAALNRSINDTGAAGVSLASLVNIMAKIRSVSDTGTALAKLASVLNVAPETRSVSETNGKAAVSLASVTAPALNSVATSWAARVVSNGGANPNLSTQRAVSNFWNGVVAAGLDTKILICNVLAPDNLTAAMTPLIVGTGYAIWNNTNIVSGDLTINGLAGNGSNSYATTGIFPPTSISNDNDCGLVLYCYSAGTGSSNGAYDIPSATGIYIYFNNAGTQAVGQLGEDATKVTVSPPGNGYFSVQRVSSTDCRLFFANSSNAHAQIGSTNTTARSTAFPNLNFSNFALDSNIGFLGYDTSRISFFALTKGLSSSDDSTLYSLVQSLRQQLRGGSR